MNFQPAQVPMMKTRNQFYTIAGLGSVLLWATNSAVTISVVRKIGPLTTLGLVMLVAGGILASYQVIRYGRISAVWDIGLKYAVLGGLAFFMHESLFYVAFYLSRTDTVALQLNLINYLWPIFVIIFSVILLKYRIKVVYFLLGLGSGLVGITITLNDRFIPLQTNLTSILPYVLMLMSSISWGIYSNLAKKYHNPDKVNGIPLFFLVIGVGALIMSRLVDEQVAWDPSVTLPLAYVALFPMALAYTLWENGVKRGNIIILGVSSYFLPLLSTLFTGYYLDVQIRGSVLWGAIMLMIGAVLTERGVEPC